MPLKIQGVRLELSAEGWKHLKITSPLWTRLLWVDLSLSWASLEGLAHGASPCGAWATPSGLQVSPVTWGTPVHLPGCSDHEAPVRLALPHPLWSEQCSHRAAPLWTFHVRVASRLHDEDCHCQRGCLLWDACGERPSRGLPRDLVNQNDRSKSHT